jgi:hypothetical protein
MDHKKTEHEIGGNLLIGLVVVAGTFLGASYMNFKNKSNVIKSGMPIKDNSEIEFDVDPKTKKFKVKRKTEFEVKEPKRETIIKEVPVVEGFKKRKKVQVDVDENGNEILGTQKDFAG